MNDSESYMPDYRLSEAYDEAMLLDEKGFEGLCPFYVELTEASERYEDGELLGKGAVKEVYKSFNRHTKRWVAMARLRADRGPEFYDLFLNEAWLTAGLNHPNIITIHDAGVDGGGRPFFTMDLKGDSNLADRAAESRPENRGELLEIFMKVCDAISYAHAQGVIHLDLKPENIQADRFGEVLVCDWGLAKLLGDHEDAQNEMPQGLRSHGNMTLMGQIKGSLGYMAPEQVLPGSVKNERSDIFALGCILHLILTGHPPFTGSNDEILEATHSACFTPPRLRYPECRIPQALEAVVLKAAAKRPEDRYSSVELLRRDISSFLGGYSTLAEKPSWFREVGLFIRRNRLPVSIVFIAAVLLSAAGVLTAQHMKRQQVRAEREQQRAAQFETKAQNATALYQEEMKRSERERILLARELAASASNLKKLGIFIRPVETVREAHQLVASAFALDAACATARLQYFSLSCIAMDFRSALERPVKPISDLADYLLFAQAFPEFNYNENQRPSIGTLTAFLQQAKQVNPDRQALMERMVAYDFAARSDKDDYVGPVQALLEYVNKRTGDPVLMLDTEHAELTVSSKKGVRLTSTAKWASQESLLRFLPFRSLTLDIKGRFHFWDLDRLDVETVDLRSCKEVVFDKTVSLPRLRVVTVRPGQFDVSGLKDVIQSNNPFEIIEKPVSED